MSEAATPAIGHNAPPVRAPKDADLLEDLRRRFPELDQQYAQFCEDLKGYPDEFTLADEDVAQKLQDLLGDIKKHQSIVAAHKKTEKKPWDGLVKVVQNFFAKHDEKADALLGVWVPRYERFLELKVADNLAKQQAEADRLRKVAEENERRAAEAEATRLAAEKDALESARKKADAEAAAAKAKADEDAAKERARQEEQAAEQRRIEQAERDRQAKRENTEDLAAVKRQMATAEGLHENAELMGEETTDAVLTQLDGLIRPGGSIGELCNRVISRGCLTEDQDTQLTTWRERLVEMRKAVNARWDAKEKRRRTLEAKAEEKRLADARTAQEAQREEQRRQDALAQERADQAARDAAAAKETTRAAREDVQEAHDEHREASAGLRTASRDSKAASTEADRSGNKVAKLDQKLEHTSDAERSRTRGDFTTGGLAGRWRYEIADENALRTVCGPLAEYFMDGALEGAVFRCMQARMHAFEGETVEPADLPGVVFRWDTSARIG